MVDISLNGYEGNLMAGMDTNNLALDKLQQKARGKVKFVKQTCKSIWYLVFKPDQVGEGYVYFNAALDAGYAKMFMIDKNDDTHPEIGFAVTQNWKDKFDAETGSIKTEIPFRTKDAHWFFCKPKMHERFNMDPSNMRPLREGEIVYFDINKRRRPECKYEDDSFAIEKVKNDAWNEYYTFDASNGAGRSRCPLGEISMVYVHIQAQNCGLGTLLTKLCLMDNNMNGPHGNVNSDLAEQNLAMSTIQNKPEKREWVQHNCKSLWLLLFLPSRDQMSAGKAYFRAAIDSGQT